MKRLNPHMWKPYNGPEPYDEVCDLCGAFSGGHNNMRPDPPAVSLPCPEPWPEWPDLTEEALFLSQMTAQSVGLLQLAAEIDGLRVILPIPLRWFLYIRGYDLSSAANALAKLSELQDGDSHEDADFSVQVQDSLCLPVDSKHRELAERYRRLKSAVL